MKIKAWTMAELSVAMVIIIVLSYASITVMKTNNVNSAKIFTYAMMKNFAYANGAISDKYGEFYPSSASETSGDWYCKNLSDMFNMTNSPDCKTESAKFNFPNGATVEGIAKPWSVPYLYRSETCLDTKWCKEEPDFLYKNILLDVNGDKAPNKLGIDRVPLRVYRGYSALGGDISGLVTPACGEYDYVHDPKGNVVKLTVNSYCETGFDFIQDNELVSYNIYRTDKVLDSMKDWSSGKMKDKSTTATLVIGTIPYMQADCMAYGGNGFFNKVQCSTAGYRLHEKCANYDICKKCSGTLYGSSYNVCPASYNSVAACQSHAQELSGLTKGPEQSCFAILNKPMQGVGFLSGVLMGDIDM